MAVAKVVTAQRNFSAGELDPEAKRNEENPRLKAGARQASNFRILDSQGIADRPGRSVLFLESTRVGRVLMAPGALFYVAFPAGRIRVYDATGTRVFDQGGFAWTAANASLIRWAVYDKSIYIACAGQQPQILTWDGVVTWSVASFDAKTLGIHKRTPFFRLAPKGNNLALGGTSGAGVSAVWASAFLTAGMVGTRIRYGGKQMVIATFTNSTNGTVNIQEPLSGSQTLTISGSSPYGVGQVVAQSSTGAAGTVTGSSGSTVTVNLNGNPQFGISSAFVLSTYLTDGTNSRQITGVADNGAPASDNWDQEVMNAYQGWPASVAIDQGRLILSNFPALPHAIVWSATVKGGGFTDLDADAYASDGLATDAIFELVPNKAQVFDVVAGPEANEFVFCDNGIYYVPISVTNPLKPGSVQFILLSADGGINVQPRIVGEAIIYMASAIKVGAIEVFGAYSRPYAVNTISELHSHLFNAPIAIAAPQGETTYPERYLYVLNGDGTIAIGKYTLGKSGVFEGVSGWLPWSSPNGAVTWIAAQAADLILTTAYSPNGIGAVSVVEVVDAARYLDAAAPLNPAPTALQQAIAAGTNIGNMTGNGGLAGAFNGTRVQNAAASSDLAAADGYVGRHFTVAQVIGQALVWPSSDSGFVTGGTGNITIELRGKATAPANATDGTLLATTTLAANQTTGPIVLSPQYSTTTYAYGWVHISRTGSTHVTVAQLLMQTGPLWWLPGGTVSLMDQVTRAITSTAVAAIGNMTGQGGLNAAFNGAYVKAQAASAGIAAADGYVGLNYGAPQIVGGVLVWPASDVGFAVGGSGNVTISLYGKATAPANSTDGTLLGQTAIADQTTGPVTLAIAAALATTPYQYVWVDVTQSGATAIAVAQLFVSVGASWWLGGNQAQIGGRMMGTYVVDSAGNIVPQNNAGENLASATLTVGQPWTATLEPFIPAVQPGQDSNQRMRKRRLARVEVYVLSSTGFVMARLFGGPVTPTSVPTGTIMKQRRISAWNIGDDPTLPPPLREQSYSDRPLGRLHDPRWALIKDTPGPLTVLEVDTEVTV